MDEKELFKDNCFLPCWGEISDEEEAVSQKKDLTILLAELEEIKNNIENITAKQWHLAKLMKFHQAGLALQ